jgi:hypothetical protein
MNFSVYKKRILILCLSLAFLIISIILSKFITYFGAITVSIFVINLILIQYFDLEYRWAIGIALFLLAICPFLLIAKRENLAESFAIYAYGYLVFGLLFILMDRFRGKLKIKGWLILFKKVMISLIFISILISNYLIFTMIFPEYKNIQPFKAYSLFKLPVAYKWLRNQPGKFLVAEFPFWDEHGDIYSDYFDLQKIHGIKLFNTLLMDEEKSKLLFDNGFKEDMNQFIKGKESRKVAKLLGYYGVKYLILHREKLWIGSLEDKKNNLEGFKLLYSGEKTDILLIEESLQKPLIQIKSNINFLSREFGLIADFGSYGEGKDTNEVVEIWNDFIKNEYNNFSNLTIFVHTSDVSDNLNGNEGVIYDDFNPIPSMMNNNSSYYIPLFLFNTGSRVWHCDNRKNIVNVSYHWLNNKTKEMVIFDGNRTSLSHNVIPGEIVQVYMEIKTPEKPGDYILQIDLVRETEYWFSWKEIKPLSKEVKVVMNDETELENDFFQIKKLTAKYFEFDNKNYPITYYFNIPKDGEYTFYFIKKNKPVIEEIKYSLDGKLIKSNEITILDQLHDSSSLQGHYPNSIQSVNQNKKFIIKLFDTFLNEGRHELTFQDSRFLLDENRFLDSYFLILNNFIKNNKITDGDLDFILKKISSDSLIIKVEASNSFFLILNNIYYSVSKAHYDDGREIKIFYSSGYSLLYLDKVGKYDLVIHFDRNDTGIISKQNYIFWLTTILCIFIIIIVWIKPMHLKKFINERKIGN